MEIFIAVIYIGAAMTLDLTLFLQDNGKHNTKSNFMPQPSSKDPFTWSRTLEGSSITTDNVQQLTETSLVTRRSTTGSIPLPSSHVHRTQSEVQLSLDEAAAERRDTSMFYRLVNGIRERQHVISHDSSASQHLNQSEHTRLADIPSDAPADAHTHTHTQQANKEDTDSQGLSDATNDDEVPGGTGGWSITGYIRTHHNHNPTPTATMATDAVNKEADDDECMFDLDF